MIILVVALHSMNPAQVNDLTRHFGVFFSKDNYSVEYPVSTRSEGTNLFDERFGDGTIHDGRVYAAWLIEEDCDLDDFVPHEEDGSGTTVMEWTPALGWGLFPACD